MLTAEHHDPPLAWIIHRCPTLGVDAGRGVSHATRGDVGHPATGRHVTKQLMKLDATSRLQSGGRDTLTGG